MQRGSVQTAPELRLRRPPALEDAQYGETLNTLHYATTYDGSGVGNG